MKKFCALFLSGLTFCPPLFGIGIRIGDQDARATARGDAFTATADTPSAVYYNPAGITQLEGFQLRVGTYAITVDAQYRSPQGEFFDNNSQLQAIPQFYATYQPANSPITVGLGYYIPFGLSVTYPSDAPFSTIVQGSRITYQSLNPVIAWKPIKQLSIAAGLTVNHAETAQRVKTPQINGEYKLEGSGNDVGFNLGILWQPTPQHSFGVQYHSATDVRLSGHSYLDTDAFSAPTPLGVVRFPSMRVERDADANFHFPQYATFGYSFRPTPQWNFEADIDWSDWTKLNTLNIHQQGAAEQRIQFDWQNSLAFEFGITRQLPKGLHLSAGYLYTQHTVPENRFDPTVPDNRRHIFSIGLGQEYGRASWDVAYQYAYQPTRSISNETAVDGDYRLRANAFSLSLGYRF